MSLAGAVCVHYLWSLWRHSLPFGVPVQIFFSLQHGKHEVPKYDTFLFATNTEIVSCLWGTQSCIQDSEPHRAWYVAFPLC